MAGTVSVNVDFKANIGQIQGSIRQIQNSLSQLRLPANLKTEFSTIFTNLNKEITNFSDKTKSGAINPLDAKEATQSYEAIVKMYTQLQHKLSASGFKNAALEKTANQIDILNTKFQDFNNKIRQSQEVKAFEDAKQKAEAAKVEVDQLNESIKQYNSNIKLYKEAAAGYEDQKKTAGEELLKAAEGRKYLQKYVDAQDVEGLAAYAASHPKTSQNIQAKAAEYEAAKERIVKNIEDIANAERHLNETKVNFKDKNLSLQAFTQDLEKAKQVLNNFTQREFKNLITSLSSNQALQGANINWNNILNPQDLEKAITNLAANGKTEMANFLAKMVTDAGQGKNALNSMGQSLKAATSDLQKFTAQQQEVDRLYNSLAHFFSISSGINLFKRAIKSAYDAIKELDAAMTEVAVVTDFSVADMWEQLPDYTAKANELGLAISDVYNASALYYQQGLNTAEVNSLVTSTLHMARIASLDATVATDRMTNAMRGFNMEINETNATRVADVYSNLAAKSASNVNELSTAMTKTASIASSANMSFENTAAFLAQGIETTRESADTIGTMLKTVIGRFTEVKKAWSSDELKAEVEGEEIDVNRVSTALREAGINLNEFFTGAKGLDEIFIELSSKWDSLDLVTQRYIATQAAGSRQQSRFIAMMQDYARQQELIGYAYNAAGASQEQYEKTLDSMESKLNQLKNAWDTFTMGVANNQLVKAGVDGLTALITVLNNLTNAFGTTGGVLTKMGLAVGGFFGARSLLTIGLKGIVSTFMNYGQQTGNGFLNGFKTVLNPSAFGNVIKNTFGKGKGGYNLNSNLFQGLEPAIRNEINGVFKNAGGNLNWGSLFAGLSSSSIQSIQNELAPKIQNLDTSQWSKNAQDAQQSLLKNTLSATEYAKALDTVSQEAIKFGDSSLLVTKAVQGQIMAENQAIQAMQTYSAALSMLAVGLSTVGKFLEKQGKVEAAQVFNNLATAAGVAAAALMILPPIIVSIGKSIGFANASIATVLPPLLIITGAVLALIGIISAIDAAIESDAEHNERWAKSLDLVSESANASANQLQELKDGWNELTELNSTLDTLIVGTAEWNSVLEQINNKVLDLLDKFPQLAQYVKLLDSGQLGFAEKDYDAIIAEQEKAVANANQAQLNMAAVVKYNEAQASKEQYEQNQILEQFSERQQQIDNARALIKSQYDAILYREIVKQNIDWRDSSLREFFPTYDIDDNSGLFKEIKVHSNSSDELAAYLADQVEAYYNSSISVTDEMIQSNFRQQELQAVSAARVAALNNLDDSYRTNPFANFVSNNYNSKGYLDAIGDFTEKVDEWINQGSDSDLAKEILSKGYTSDAAVGTQAYFEDIYRDVFGVTELPSYDNPKELATAIASNPAIYNNNPIKEFADNMEGAIDVLNDLDEDTQKAIIDGFNGALDEKVVDKIIEGGAESAKGISDALGINTKDYVKVANALGYVEEGLADFNTAFVNRQKEAYVDNMLERVQLGTFAAMFTNQDITDRVVGTSKAPGLSQALTIEQIKLTNDALSTLQSSLSADIVPKVAEEYLSTVSQFRADEYADFIQSIDFSNPIEGAETLLAAAQETDLAYSHLAEIILTDQQFSLGSQLDYFVDDLITNEKSLSDLADESGNITADSLRDAAKESELLSGVLRNASNNANGLAKVLNLANQGVIKNLSQVSNTVIDAIGKLNSYEDHIKELHEFISDFSPGLDTGESYEFLTDAQEKIKEFLENGEYGNQQLRGYLDLFMPNWNNANPDLLGTGTTEYGEQVIASMNAAQQQIDAWMSKNGFGYIEAAMTSDKGLFDYEIDEDGWYNFTNLSDNISENIQDGESAMEAFSRMLQESTGSSKALADNMAEVFANWSPDFANEMEKIDKTNDLASLTSGAIDNTQGNLYLTVDEQSALASAGITIADIEAYIAKQKLQVKVQVVPEYEENTDLSTYKQFLADTFNGGNGEGKIKVDVHEAQAALEGLIGDATEAQSILTDLANKGEIGLTLKVTTVDVENGEATATTQTVDIVPKVDQPLTWEQIVAIEDKISANAIVADDFNSDSIKEKITNSLAEGGQAGATQIEAAVNSLNLRATIQIDTDKTSVEVLVTGNLTPLQAAIAQAKAQVTAAGLTVTGAATGIENAQTPGHYLLGEIGPELKISKTGEAILEGVNGPTVDRVEKGDTVYTAKQTEQILKGKNGSKKLSGFAIGRPPSGSASDDSGSGTAASAASSAADAASSAADAADSSKEAADIWLNGLDKLYNLVAEADEWIRRREILEKKFEQYTYKWTSTFYNYQSNFEDQLKNLRHQYGLQNQLQLGRLEQLRNVANEKYKQDGNITTFAATGATQYARYNEATNTISIDWDRIDQITDTNLGEAVEAYISRLEELQDMYEDAHMEMYEIVEEIEKIEEEYKKVYGDFIERIYDAIVQQEQERIDSLEKAYDQITEDNDKVIDALQKSIELERQIRDNTEKEQEISDKERQLAFLRRDTSNGNLLQIKKLEKEISDLKEDYSDELIDQKLDLLQEDNEKAAEQREKQIQLLQDKLDYDKEHGTFWETVETLLSSGINKDGTVNVSSDLFNLLSDVDNVAGMSEESFREWLEELSVNLHQALVGMEISKPETAAMKTIIESEQKGLNWTQTTGVPLAQGGSLKYNSDTQKWSYGAQDKYHWDITYDATTGSYSYTNGSRKTLEQQVKEIKETTTKLAGKQYWGDGPYLKLANGVKVYYNPATGRWSTGANDPYEWGQIFDYGNGMYGVAKRYDRTAEEIKLEQEKAKKLRGYLNGGLVDYTGLAWLDGTKNNPELVLNARDTQNFIMLKDILSESLQKQTNVPTSKGGDNYFDITIEVDEIGSDYDVEQLTAKIKDEIRQDSMYRNVNALNFLR